MPGIGEKRMKNRKRGIKFCIAYLVLCIGMTSLFASTTTAASQYNSTRVAVGDGHALLIDSAGNLWSFGNNSSGQLGDGSTTSKDSPVMVYSKTWKGGAISVAAGSIQSLALLEDGTVLMWGYGNPAQRTAIDKKAFAIAAGGDKCLAILQTGDAVCWSDASAPLPVKTTDGKTLKNVNEIAVGSDDFLILRAGTEGSVYQLHLSSAKDSWIASKVEKNTDTGTSDSSSVTTATLTADSISAGSGFGVALSVSGDVYTWGKNSESGVLGNGTFGGDVKQTAEKVNVSSIQKISAGSDHVIVIDNSGNAFGWGNARNKRLDAGKSDPGYALPEPIDLGITGISQFDAGNTWNVALNGSEEFFSWGNNQATRKLILKQTLFKTPTPSVTASLVGDQMMTITWKPEEFYTEIALGFFVTYTTPNGIVGKTLLLPLTSPQITLRGLQAATNYKITLSILGKTGYEEASPVFVVQTAKASNVSSSLESQADPSIGPTNTQPVVNNSSESSGAADNQKSMLFTLFRLVLIILVLLASSAAVIAFVYLWRRYDKEKRQKIKPVRVTPENTAAAGIEGGTASLGADNGPEIEDSDMKIISDRGSLNAIVPGLVEEEPADADMPAEPEESRSAENTASEDEGDFLVRLPDTSKRGDEEDDFIIRKPGDPKR